MSRILAIDYGIKRTGIAVTDEMQLIAFGLTTIPSDTAITFLKDYFSKEKVERVIVGEPKQMDGTPSQSAEIINAQLETTHAKPGEVRQGLHQIRYGCGFGDLEQKC